jgi:hypothetical protein
MGAMQRNKGKSGEREVIVLLQPIVRQVYEAHEREVPVLKRNTMQSDGGGFDIHGLEWLALEVKWHKDLKVNQWWQQTVEQAGTTRMPVLAYRTNGQRMWTFKLPGLLGTRACNLTVPVTVCQEDFLQWFRNKLNHELETQQ